MAPWEYRLKATISERDEAAEWARTTTEGVVYVDASFRKANIGVGLYFSPRWETKREPLRKAAGTRWGDVPYLLGGRCVQVTPNGQPLDGPADSWAPDIEIVKKTIKFTLSTGRLRRVCM